MKKIIVILVMMLFLVGCGYKSSYHYPHIPKIESNDEKEIIEYVVKTIQMDMQHKIELDYKTLKTWRYSEETDNGSLLKGTSIFVDCKIKGGKYFIQVKNFNNKPNYFVSIVEE